MAGAAWTVFSPDELGTAVVGRSVRFFESVGSTNDLLKDAARAGAEEGLVFVADEQVAGRGRRGRAWTAPPASSLLSSALLRPTWLVATDAFLITMLAAVAAAEAIESCTGLRVGLKWPNDLHIGARKVGGILIETELSNASVSWIVIGCGINVNWDPRSNPELADRATSLSDELGRPAERRALLRALLSRLDARYLDLRRGARSALHQDWRDRLITLGQPVSAETPQGELLGVAIDVTPDGALVLRDQHGQHHLIAAGDVTIRPTSADLG